MSSDDPTMELPDDKPGYDTRPGVTAILERINELGARLEKKIDDSVGELRQEMRSGFGEVRADIRMLNKKIDTLAADVLGVRADQKLLEDRVEKIERKPS